MIDRNNDERPQIENLEERILMSASPVQDESFVAVAVQTEPAAQAPPAQVVTEIVIVDSGVKDPAAFLASIPATAEVHVLNSDSSGVDQITAILAGKTGITALHIVSHGADGQINLGNASLNAGNVGQTAAWQASFSDSADILLYGCDVAQDAQGIAFVKALATTTGADVAASDDITSSQDQVLEVSVGKIDAERLSMDALKGSLAAGDSTINDVTNALGATYRILGSPTVDSILTAAIVADPLATTPGLDDPDGVPTLTEANYQWQISGDGVTGWTNFTIPANGLSITVTAAMANLWLRNVLTFTDNGAFAETQVSDAIFIDGSVPSAGATGGEGRIIGNARPGNTLTATVTDLDAGTSTSTFSYTWERRFDGSNYSVVGDSTGSYTLTAADVGSQIRFTVRYVDDLGNYEVGQSTPVTVTPLNSIPTGSPMLDAAIVRVGTLLQPDSTAINDSNGYQDTIAATRYTYYWEASTDGQSNWTALATAANYTPLVANVNQYIRVVSQFTDNLGNVERVAGKAQYIYAAADTVQTAPSSSANAPTYLKFTADSSTQSPTVLTANITGLSDADGLPTSFSYQWQRSSDNGATWTSIADATAATYTVDAAFQTSAYRVVLSYTDGAGNAETFASQINHIIQNRPVILVNGTSNINPATAVGNTLVADIDGVAFSAGVATAANALADTDGLVAAVYTYQWQVSSDATTWTNAAGGGATTATYTTTTADLGMYVRVVVSTVDNFGNAESIASLPTARFNAAQTAGTIVATGTTTVGQILDADFTVAVVDPNGNPTSFTYQWQSSVDGISWVNILNAIDHNYTLQANDSGKTIRVVASYVDGNGFTETVTSAATAAINSPSTGEVTIGGSAVEGQTLEADISAVVDLNDTTLAAAYLWQTSNDGLNWTDTLTVVKTYTLAAADGHKYLRVRVTFSDDVVTSSTVIYSGRTERVNDINNATVTVAYANSSVSMTVGSTVEADITAITIAQDANDVPAFSNFGFQWQSSNDGGISWSSIAGATLSRYTLASEDAGTQLRVVVRYTDNDGYSETVTSTNNLGIVNSASTGLPTITGSAVEGQILSSDVSAIADLNDATLTFTYQWQNSLDGITWANIALATSDTYTVVTADGHRYVRVQVVATDSVTTTTTTLNSASTVRVNDIVSGTLTVNLADGAVAMNVGSTLEADASALVDANTVPPAASFIYQWQASNDGGNTWVNIAGATSARYTLTANESGKTVRAVASYTDLDGYAESVVSGATAVINSASTGLPVIGGLAIEGQTLTANTAGITDLNDATLTFTYQWQTSVDGVNWTDLAGAIAQTLALTAANGHNYIRVQVVATDSVTTTTTTLTSAATVRVNDIATGTVVVAFGNGATQVRTGVLLEADVTGAFVDANGVPVVGNYSYQWQYSTDGDNGAPEAWSNISGATGPTYTVAEAMSDKVIRVVVSFTDLDGYSETIISATSAIVNNRASGGPVVDGDRFINLLGGTTLTANVSSIGDLNGISTNDGATDGFGNDAVEGITYQWQSSSDNGITWTNVVGATASTYTVQVDSYGLAFRVVTTFTDNDTYVEIQTSASTGNLWLKNNTTATILGVRAPTQTLTAMLTGPITDLGGNNTGAFDTNTVNLNNVSYVWQRSVDGGNNWYNVGYNRTYTLTDADMGTQLKFAFTYTDDHGIVESGSSAALLLGIQNQGPTGKIQIDGITQEGVSVTANTSRLEDENGINIAQPVTYTWQTSVDGLTGWTTRFTDTSVIPAISNYTVQDPSLGRYLRLVYTYVDGIGNTETSFGDAKYVYEAAQNVTTGVLDGISSSSPRAPTYASFVVDSSTKSPSTLTANLIGLNDPDGLPGPDGFSYQWQVSSDNGVTWTSITGATATQYTVADNAVDHSKVYRVTLTYVDGAGNTEAFASVPNHLVQNRPAVLIAGAINGVLNTVGQVLTADTNGEAATATTEAALALSDADQVGTVTAALALAAGPDGVVGLNPITGVNDDPTYQWEISLDGITWVNATGGTATQAAYATVATDLGHYLRVVVSYTDSQGNRETVASLSTARFNQPATGTPIVQTVKDNGASGTVVATATSADLVIGQILTTDPSVIADSNGVTNAVFSYNWMTSLDGLVWTSVGTDRTYILTANDAHKFVRVTVSLVDDDGFAESRTSASTDQQVNSPVSGQPVIVGAAVEGVSLRADLSGLSDINGFVFTDALGTASVGVTFAWQSSVDGVVWTTIAGATAQNYTLTATEGHKFVRVLVSYIDVDTHAQSVLSAATVRVDGNQSGTVVVALGNGETQVKVGGLVEADVTVAFADPNGVPAIDTYTYQWEFSTDAGASWTTIAGATGRTYTISQAMADKQLRVVTSFVDLDGYTETIVSAASAVVNSPVTGAPVVVGSAVQGQILTADVSAIADANGLGAFTYTWQSSEDGVIWAATATSANAQTYTVAAGDSSKYLRALVTFTDADGYSESTASVATALVDGHVTAGTVVVALGNGETQVKVGALVEADVTVTFADPNGVPAIDTYTYQWEFSTDDGASWTAIAGATGRTYTISQAMADKRLRVVTQFVDLDGYTETIVSAQSAVVNNPVTGKPVVLGSVVDTMTLTAETSALGDLNGLGAFTYAWKQSVDGITWTAAPGTNNAATYTIPEDLGHVYLQVTVTFTDGDGYSESTTSLPTVRVNDTVDGKPVITGAPLISTNLAVAAVLTAPSATSYQWQSSADGVTWTNIALATGATYTVVIGDSGKFIRAVGTSGVDVVTTTKGIVGGVANVLPAAVKQVGKTLFANLNDSVQKLVDNNGLPGSYSYSWQTSVDGINWITVGSSQTYTIAQADQGKQVRVLTTYTDLDGYVESTVSAAVTISNSLATGTPVIIGEVKDETVLTANVTGITDIDALIASAVTFTYQWQYFDTTYGWQDINGATAKTFTPDDRQVGYYLRVAVTVNDSTATAEAFTTLYSAQSSVVVAETNDPTVGTVTMQHKPASSGSLVDVADSAAGRVTDGDVLSLVNGLFDEDNSDALPGAAGEYSVTVGDHTTELKDAAVLTSALTYQWQVSYDGVVFTDIVSPAASQPTYGREATFTVTANEHLKYLRTKVSYVDEKGFSQSVYTAVTPQIRVVNAVPSIDGVVKEDSVLTANTDKISIDPIIVAGLQYQWYANGVAISGATAKTFVPSDAQYSKVITVRVTYMYDSIEANPTLWTGVPSGFATGNSFTDGLLTTFEHADQEGFDYVNALNGHLYGVRVSADSVAVVPVNDVISGDVIIKDVTTSKVLDAVNNPVKENKALMVDISALIDADVNPYNTDHGVLSNLGGSVTGVTELAPTTPSANAVTVTYVWQSWDGTSYDTDGSKVWLNIGTAATYTPSDLDYDKVIRVVVTIKDNEGFTQSVTSAATMAVRPVNDIPTGVINVVADVNGNITADAGTAITVDSSTVGGFQFSTETVLTTNLSALTDRDINPWSIFDGTGVLPQSIYNYFGVANGVELAQKLVLKNPTTGALVLPGQTVVSGELVTAYTQEQLDLYARGYLWGTTAGSVLGADDATFNAFATYQWQISDNGTTGFADIAGKTAKTLDLKDKTGLGIKFYNDKFVRVVTTYVDEEGFTQVIRSAAHLISDKTLPAVPTLEFSDKVVTQANEKAFVFRGIGEAGATIELTITDSLPDGNDLLTFTSTILNDGTWTITKDLSTFGEGKLSVSAVVRDLASNLSSPPLVKLLLKDTLVGSFGMVGAANIGSANIDSLLGDVAANITVASTDLTFNAATLVPVTLDNVTGYVVSGTGEAGATVTLVYSDDKKNLLGVRTPNLITVVATVDANGVWTTAATDLSSLTDGPINIKVTEVDRWGNLRELTTAKSTFSKVDDLTATFLASTVRNTGVDALPGVGDIVKRVVGVPNAPVVLTAPEITFSNEKSWTVTGTGNVGNSIILTIGGITKSTVVDSKGQWEIVVDVTALPVGTDYLLQVVQQTKEGVTGNAATQIVRKALMAEINGATNIALVTDEDLGVTAAANYSLTGKSEAYARVYFVAINNNGSNARDTDFVDYVNADVNGDWAIVDWNLNAKNNLKDGSVRLIIRTYSSTVTGKFLSSDEIWVKKDTTSVAPSIGTLPVLNNANASAYKVTGRAEAGATVTVTVSDSNDVEATASAVADSKGVYTVVFNGQGDNDDLTEFIGGDATLKVIATQVDRFGNANEIRGTIAKTMANHAMTLDEPVIDGTDLITAANVGKYTVTGTASAGLKVSVNFGGVIKTTTANSLGIWKVVADLRKVAADEVEITATASDRYGNIAVGITEVVGNDVFAAIIDAENITSDNRRDYTFSFTKAPDAEITAVKIGGKVIPLAILEDDNITFVSGDTYELTLNLDDIKVTTGGKVAIQVDQVFKDGSGKIVYRNSSVKNLIQDLTKPELPTVTKFPDLANQNFLTNAEISGKAQAGTTIHVIFRQQNDYIVSTKEDMLDSASFTADQKKGYEAVVAKNGTWTITGVDLSKYDNGLLHVDVMVVESSGSVSEIRSYMNSIRKGVTAVEEQEERFLIEDDIKSVVAWNDQPVKHTKADELSWSDFMDRPSLTDAISIDFDIFADKA